MDTKNLDPTDWDEFRRDGHAALDLIIDHLRTIRERPVWRPAPDVIRDGFRKPLPRGSRGLADVLAQVDSDIRPYVTGNVHPLFMGWVHGAGTPVGMIAEMLAAGLNANCGGRNHIAHDVERQVTRWVAEALGLPAESSGLFVTGSSMANFIGLLVARTKVAGRQARARGMQATEKRLVAYASREAHQCVGQAMELAGLGLDNLRLIATNSARQMRADLLAEAIDEDIKAGRAPFLVVGSAGTVNTGSVDPLDAVADVAHARGLWFHVDGAIGAGAMLSTQLRPLMKGIERADSVALDFHKWMHVPYDAGFVIVRDTALHLETFASDAVYLSRAKSGLAAGDVWPCDLGPDLSRGFRALKTWMTFETLGADSIGACMEQNCAAARHLARRLEADRLFVLRAPVALNIVCFSVARERADALNRRIVEDLHMSGEAAPSLTTIDGRVAIRAAIVNHRTTIDDIDAFVTALNRRAVRQRRPSSAPA
ncbi:MAG: pyridoxal phosphate-dependent decarboxylase family protein [Rhodoblastus sp.]